MKIRICRDNSGNKMHNSHMSMFGVIILSSAYTPELGSDGYWNFTDRNGEYVSPLNEKMLITIVPEKVDELGVEPGECVEFELKRIDGQLNQ